MGGPQGSRDTAGKASAQLPRANFLAGLRQDASSLEPAGQAAGGVGKGRSSLSQAQDSAALPGAHLGLPDLTAGAGVPRRKASGSGHQCTAAGLGGHTPHPDPGSSPSCQECPFLSRTALWRLTPYSTQLGHSKCRAKGFTTVAVAPPSPQPALTVSVSTDVTSQAWCHTAFVLHSLTACPQGPCMVSGARIPFLLRLRGGSYKRHSWLIRSSRVDVGVASTCC